MSITVAWIPVRGDIELRTVDDSLCDLFSSVDIHGNPLTVHAERVQTPLPNLVLYVNEVGVLLGLDRNPRAEMFYPGWIQGDALLTAEVLEWHPDGPDRRPVGVPTGSADLAEWFQLVSTAASEVLDEIAAR